MRNSLRSGEPVTVYARRVSDGDIPAGKWHRLACDRHLRDLTESADGSRWVYRPELAAKAFGIFALCRHFKGEWAGQPIRLEPWQQFVVGSVMGWVDRETGLRRFRNAFIELPRGQGKSTIAGGMLVLFAFFDGEGGAEAYSVATKRDQARISFQAGRQMLLRSKALKQHVTIGKYNIHSEATESKMEGLGADADTLDGLRPHIVVVDEVHKIPSSDLIDVMESGMGTRRQPLLFEITTAGDDDQSVYGQHHLLSTRVLDQTVPLDQWFAFIAAADPEDDWTLAATWRKANPNFGVSVKPEFLRSEVEKACANPAEIAKVRRLYLGQKIQTVDSYYSVADWQACPPLPDEAELRRAPCWIGLDLSSSIDVTAAVLVWKVDGGEIAVRPHFWLPADNLEERGRRDRVPYGLFRQQGWLETTEGNVIDRAVIRKRVAVLAKEWKARAVCYDPWHAQELVQALQDQDGVKVIPVRQMFDPISRHMKDFQATILQRRVRHDHNPLMGLMVGNVVPRYDDKSNVLPSKKKSRGRIDGVQATLNALTQLDTKAPQVQVFFMGGRS
ncbi:MAG: terminase large subunit [Betaproteobacteria bacterium]|nr:terminase large subunit [Betaproteobacteria bacterium]